MADKPKDDEKSEKRKPDPLGESLLAGLAQESANPDAADEREATRIASIRPEDQFGRPMENDAEEE